MLCRLFRVRFAESGVFTCYLLFGSVDSVDDEVSDVPDTGWAVCAEG